MSYLINLSILRNNRNYRLLYTGQFVSFFGTMITTVALPYQIYHITNSTLMVGLLSLFQLLPLLVTALLGGALADRYHRRKLLLISEFLLASGCLVLAINAARPAPSIPIIFIVAIFMSGISGLHRPALDSMIQQIVPKNDFAMVAALTTFMYSVGMIAGPAAGGLLMAHFGISTTFLVDFATFFISWIALALMGEIARPASQHIESAWKSVKQGFSFALSRQELLGSYSVDFVAMVFGMPMALFPAIAQHHGGASTLGMLYSAPAVGALAIAFVGGFVTKIKRHGAAIAISAALWGVSIIGFGLANNLLLALFFLALAGLFDAASGMFRQTMWNESIPNNFRGRLSGIEMISYLSGPKLGDTEAGLVAAAFGITASVVSGGVLCVVSVAVCCYALPKFWRYHSTASSSSSPSSEEVTTSSSSS
jgi:MFS family permease